MLHSYKYQVPLSLQHSHTLQHTSNKRFLPYKHCDKMGHPPFKCWRRSDVKCEKCNKLGHHVRICKNNFQQKNVAQVASQQEEEQLFKVTYFTSSSSSECWLMDSGCTNHMTQDQELFKELDKSQVSKVKIDNGDLIIVEGKETVAIESCASTKLIYDVLYVHGIHQNLVSVGQLNKEGEALTDSSECRPWGLHDLSAPLSLC